MRFLYQMDIFPDPQLFEKTGKAHMTVDLAEEYGFTDIDGNSYLLVFFL
jgi:hypothetical protein